MKEVREFIDIIEKRHKTYLELFNELIIRIGELENSIEELEKRVYSLEMNDPPF